MSLFLLIIDGAAVALRCLTSDLALLSLNKGFPNEPDVGYRNFFIPRVEKTSKNEPAGRKSLPPKGRRPAGGELFLPKGLF